MYVCQLLQEMKFSLLSSVTTVSMLSMSSLIYGQNLCDDSYALHCPEESGWDVGECLKKQTDLAATCESFIALHDICKVQFAFF